MKSSINQIMPDADIARAPVPYLTRNRLRIRRWLMALCFYLIGLPFAVYGWLHGQLDALSLQLAGTVAALANILVFCLLISGRNERLRDPSLTALQIVCAMTCSLILVAGASDVLRPTMAIGVVAPLLFGVFQLDLRGFVRLALYGFVGQGLALLVVALTRGMAQPVVDLTHLAGQGLLLVVFVAICGEMLRMRARQQRLMQQLQESADRDALTGLWNRRWLTSQLPLQLELARRHQRPFSACMIDLDHFKRINDRDGHQAGDSALQCQAAAVGHLLRQSDALVRCGGEEFLLLLPETDQHGAAELAQRICRALAANPVDLGDGRQIHVTVSIGTATLQPGDTADQLLARADEALYAAKQRGRNQVVQAS